MQRAQVQSLVGNSILHPATKTWCSQINTVESKLSPFHTTFPSTQLLSNSLLLITLLSGNSFIAYRACPCLQSMSLLKVFMAFWSVCKFPYGSLKKKIKKSISDITASRLSSLLPRPWLLPLFCLERLSVLSHCLGLSCSLRLLSSFIWDLFQSFPVISSQLCSFLSYFCCFQMCPIKAAHRMSVFLSYTQTHTCVCTHTHTHKPGIEYILHKGYWTNLIPLPFITLLPIFLFTNFLLSDFCLRPYSEIISLNCWGLNSTAFYRSVFFLPFSSLMKLWFPSLVSHWFFPPLPVLWLPHLPSLSPPPPPSRAAAQGSGVPPAISLHTPCLSLLGRPSPWWWPCPQCQAPAPCSRSWWVVSTWEQHHLSTFIL